MSELYTPNDVLENQIMSGIILHQPFLDHCLRKRVGPIFLGTQRELKNQIAAMCLRYFELYGVVRPLDTVMKEIERLAMLENRSVDVELAATRTVLRYAIESQPAVDQLPALLDEQLEIYRHVGYLEYVREVGARFYSCRFRYQKHELCAGCPFTDQCRQADRLGRTFSQTLIDMNRTHLDKMEAVASGATTVDVDLFAELPNTVTSYDERRLALAAQGRDQVGIKAPWPTVNREAGGWIRTNLYGVFAERKTGKTTALINIAEAAVRDRANVLFCFMEDTPQRFRDKVASSMAGISYTDLLYGTLTAQEYDYAVQRMAHYKAAYDEGLLGELHGCYAPLRGIGLSRIRRRLSELRTRGVRIDILLFDHIHIAKLELTHGAMKAIQLVEFVEGLKAIAQEENLAAVAAGQLKTSGDRKGSARWADEMEDSFDAVYHLTQQEQRLELSTAYARYFSPFTIPMEDHRDRVLLVEARPQAEIVTNIDLLAIPKEGFLK